MNLIVGMCSLCGGQVTVPQLWAGTLPPVPTCQRCPHGAGARTPPDSVAGRGGEEAGLMLTVFLLFAVAAFICTIVAAIGRCPLWIAVMLLCVLELLRVIPLGK